jgi:hypothetical protein
VSAFQDGLYENESIKQGTNDKAGAIQQNKKVKKNTFFF